MLAPQLGFVAGLALHDAAAAVTGLAAPRLALKWPNDLLVDRAKAAGLLLEGESRAGQFSVIIGLGVNIASSPQDTPYAATHLAAHAQGASVERLLIALSEAWHRRFSAWSLPGGFGPTRAAWLERAAFLGEIVTLRLPEGPVSGRFHSLDPGGRLELETSAGLRIIDAGDLFFGAQAAPAASGLSPP
jgi:BirA family biotin operon repressor/biotin-[acetyl-CoA-carboxylase] ligase